MGKNYKELLDRVITCDYNGKDDKREILRRMLKRKYRKYLFKR